MDLLTNIENHISYKKTGDIISNEQFLEEDINKILNLNSPILIELRKQTYSDLIVLMKRQKSGTWTKSSIQKILNKYKQKNKKGQYAEHYGMLIYFLQKKISKL